MNLIKFGHTHTFDNTDIIYNMSVTDGNGFEMCEAGHSDCIPGNLTLIHSSSQNTNRTTRKNTNLTAKRHIHTSLLKSFSSDIINVTGTQALVECDAGHTECVVAYPTPKTSKKITISGFTERDTNPTVISNLIKKTSHTHTIVSEINFTFVADWWAVAALTWCDLGHSDCRLDKVGLVNTANAADDTTSSGVI